MKARSIKKVNILQLPEEVSRLDKFRKVRPTAFQTSLDKGRAWNAVRGICLL